MSTAPSFFFFNDTATTEIYTLSLHDALPISVGTTPFLADGVEAQPLQRPLHVDRKSTRLNSSHANISYAVFCLKKKKLIPSTSCTYMHGCNRTRRLTIRGRCHVCIRLSHVVT